MRKWMPILFLAIFLLAISASAMQANDKFIHRKQAGEPAAESTEVVDVTGAESSSSGVGTLIGRFHPGVVHFPIAWLVLLSLTEFISLVWKKPAWHKAGFFILIGTVLSFIPAIISGLLLSGQETRTGEELSLMLTHRNLNIAVAVLGLSALIIRLTGNKELQGNWRGVYLGLIWIATIMILISGHLGGKMVFGEAYLPF